MMNDTSLTDPTSLHARRASGRTWLDRWMALLRTVGNVQAWIILSLFYGVVIAPIGLLFRLVADPLRLRSGERCRRPSRTTTWQPLERQYDRLDQAVEQS